MTTTLFKSCIHPVQESSAPRPTGCVHEADVLNDGDEKHKAAQRILIKTLMIDVYHQASESLL